MDADFWRDRCVLVTGHTGFKGGWLTLWLARLGARVTGLALAAESARNVFVDADVAGACTSRLHDIRDLDAVRATVRDARPEIVFHLAAQPLVRASYRDPVATWSTNVMGTAHLLDACRASGDGLRAIVVVTSDKCYEQVGAPLRPFTEGDALGGIDPYSASKAGAEIVAASWRRSFFAHGDVGLATARAGNVIGGGDWSADRLIPDLARSAVDRTSVPIRSPRSTRPWQHVLDPLAGYLTLAQRLHRAPGDFDEPWNFGPDADASWTVARIAKTFVEALDRGARWQVAEDATLHEAAALSLDSSKSRSRLGWAPRFTTEEAIVATADAYRGALDGSPLGAIIERQIDAYSTRNELALAAA